MRPRDWLIVAALLAAALLAGADDLRRTPIARLLLGECTWAGGDGRPDCRAAPPEVPAGDAWGDDAVREPRSKHRGDAIPIRAG